jgi:phosphoribosyl 1,2-cyclic phosphodiesterase
MEQKLGDIDKANVRVIQPGQDFYLGDFNITPFDIPHDAAQPVGFSFLGGGMKVSVATDIGCIRESWLQQVEKSDLLLLEANHDLNMLKAGRYPYELKRRIMGQKGHLSNEDAAKAAVLLVKRGVKRLVLGHLSRENNFPELAYQTVLGALAECGLPICPPDIAKRHGLSGLYRVSTNPN